MTDAPGTDDDDGNDAAWPALSELDLQVCLTDSGIPGIAPPVATVESGASPHGLESDECRLRGAVGEVSLGKRPDARVLGAERSRFGS